jgi:hypothetical protein
MIVQVLASTVQHTYETCLIVGVVDDELFDPRTSVSSDSLHIGILVCLIGSLLLVTP